MSADEHELDSALAAIEAAFGSGNGDGRAPEAQEAGQVAPGAPAAPAGGLVHVPDPTRDLVPPGWWEHVALPDILMADTWQELEEFAARIRYVADRVEAMQADAFELEAALRVVDKRRGDLLGPAPGQGARTDLAPATSHTRVEGAPDVSPETERRWRLIAAHWEDVIYPHLQGATRRYEATQTRCLDLIRRPAQEPEAPAEATSDHATDEATSSLRQAAGLIADAVFEREQFGIAHPDDERDALERVHRALAAYRAAMEAP